MWPVTSTINVLVTLHNNIPQYFFKTYALLFLYLPKFNCKIITISFWHCLHYHALLAPIIVAVNGEIPCCSQPQLAPDYGARDWRFNRQTIATTTLSGHAWTQRHVYRRCLNQAKSTFLERLNMNTSGLVNM